MTGARTGGRFLLRGQEVYLRSGELQYFRVPPDLWRPALDRLRAAGFNAISTYVPWIVHEPQEGSLDFEGKAGAYANLVGFLEQCRAADLPVMIRPGPQIYAEFRGFGIPLWLGQHYPECVMRGSRGQLVKGSFYYYYALLHPTYLAHAERWLRHVTALLWPQFADIVVSWQIDNETGMPFGNTLGNFDFNPDTVARYRAFLDQRYDHDDKALRLAWGDTHVALDTALPPRRRTGRAMAVDWYDFLEGWVAEYLRRLGVIARDCGVAVPLVVNDLDIYLSPAAPGEKAGLAEVQGYDIYTKASGQASTADLPFAPSHDPEKFRALVAPEAALISVEMGAGWFDPRARIKPEATVQATLGGVAHGIVGHSYYVAHDGRDPDGAPYTFHSFFDAKGESTARYEAVARIHALLAAHEAEVLDATACYDDIFYLTYQPYSRLMPGDYLPGGWLPDPLLYLEVLGLHGFYDLLLTSGYLPEFADAQRIDDAELAHARIVIFPTRGWVDAATMAKLNRYVEGGGHLITFPTIVSSDAQGRPLSSARALYPHPPATSRHLGYGTVMRRLVVDFLGKYLLWQRWWLARREPAAMQNTDSFEGLKVLLNQVLPAVHLQDAASRNIRGDYRLETFPIGEQTPGDHTGDTSELIVPGGRRASCTVRLADGGTSTVWGTVPGGAYTTGAYYQLGASERAGLRDFAKAAMRARGIEPQWQSDLDLECVVRRLSDGGHLVYILNRLGDQQGTLSLAPTLGSVHEVESLWTYNGSSAILAGEHCIALTLRRDDVLVLRLRSEHQDGHASKEVPRAEL
jgi:beta-galactosidase GanA